MGRYISRNMFPTRDFWRSEWDSAFSIRACLQRDFDTTVAECNRENLTPHHRLQTYYGYSFESFCTSGTPRAKPGWGGDVDTNIQWCSVVKTKLGNTRLVIGGEVDCVRGASETLLCHLWIVTSAKLGFDKGKLTKSNDTLVELKTSLTIRGQQDESRFEK